MLELILNLVLIPAVLSAAGCLAATRLPQENLAQPLTAIAVVAGFAASYVGFTGVAPFPPTSSVQKLFYAPIASVLVFALASVVLGRARAMTATALALLAGGLAALWVLERLLGRLDTVEWLLLFAMLATLVLAWATATHASATATGVRVAHAAAATGLGLVLIFGGTATTGFFAIALAVALGASIVTILAPAADGPVRNAVAAAFLCVAAPLAAQTVLLTDTSPYALLPLPLCFLAIPVMARLGWGKSQGMAAAVVDGARCAMIAFPPAIAAAGISYSMGGGSPY